MGSGGPRVGTVPCTSCGDRSVLYSTPELYPQGVRIDSPGHAFLGDHGRDTAEGAFNIRWDGCLHAHFDGLEGAQSYVGDELSRRTGSQVNGGLPFESIFLTDKVTVELLEELVAAVLECSLGLVRISVYSHWSVRLTYAVAKESGAPAGKYSTKTLDRANRGERLHIALV
jgi:hypothetical protein